MSFVQVLLSFRLGFGFRFVPDIFAWGSIRIEVSVKYSVDFISELLKTRNGNVITFARI